jgi:hypothetical protein
MSLPFPALLARQIASLFSVRPPARDGIEPLEARIAPATFIVNSLFDGAPAADGQLTLREAILAATTNLPSGDALRGDFLFDTITFAPALKGGSITIASELLIDGGGPLSIVGPGAFDESISILGDGTRVMEITAATASVSLSHLAIKQGNAGVGNDGGGIHNSTTLYLDDVLLSQNTARDGGGIFNTGAAAQLTISHSRLLDNSASVENSSNGGAIYVTGSNAQLTMHDTLIEGNVSAEDGGGIDTNAGTFTTITASRIIGNRGASSGDGAGIQNAGIMFIEGTTISGNIGTGDQFFGGGVNTSGALTLLNSTVSDNVSEGRGGGIRLGSGTLAVLNSTIAGNTALANEGGGGLKLDGGIATIVNSTIAGNLDAAGSAGNGGGGIVVKVGVVLNMDNTIVAGNFASGAEPKDIRGAVAPLSVNNFIGIGDAALTGLANGANGNQVGTAAVPLNAKLGPLQDNGGPTFTMQPLAGSQVIDAGDDNSGGTPLGEALRNDQRGPGFARKLDGNLNSAVTIDIGAAEYAPVTALANDVTTFSFTQADTDKITVTLTGGGTFDLLRSGNDIGQITIHGGTAASALVVKVVKGATGGGNVNVGAIHADSTLKSIALGKGVNFTGTIGVEGALGSLALDTMEYDVLLRTGGTAKQVMKVTANDTFDLVIDTTSAVAPINVPKFDFRGAIRAASIGAITARDFAGGTFNDALNAGQSDAQDLIATVGGIGKITTTDGSLDFYEIRTAPTPLGIFGGLNIVRKGDNSATGISDVGITAAQIGKISVTLTSAADNGNAVLTGGDTLVFSATAGAISGISVALNFVNTGTKGGGGIGQFFILAAGAIGPVTVTSKAPAIGDISSGTFAAGTALRGWETLPTAAAQLAALKTFGLGNVTTPGRLQSIKLIAAGNIGAVTALGGTSGVSVLAGANLGKDFNVGGAGLDADIFLRPASIGAINLKTQFVNTTISAGIAAVNGVLGDTGDVAGVAGLVAQTSKIGPITIGAVISTVAANVANHNFAIQAATLGKIVVNGTTVLGFPNVLDTGNTGGMDDANDIIIRTI